jgi:VanZ family protein
MIPKDKLQHLAMGVGSAAVLGAIHFLPLGLAIAVGGIVFGAFYEFQQWYRKEGQPDVWDAIATALPGVVVGVICELFMV